MIGNARFLKIGIALLLSVAVLIPALGFAKGGETIYVDDDASGTQNGSSAHPYKTIARALRETRKGDEVVVAPGTYKENVEIPKGVKLSGSGQSKTTIKAEDRDDAVVTMKDGSEMWGFTIKNGKLGIYVKKESKATIVDSEIKENRHEGIFIDRSERNDSERTSVVRTNVIDNGWSGIYAKKGKIIISDSDIKGNGKNGVVFEAGVRGWVDDNSISENKLSGIVLQLDNADTTIASNNTFRKNGQEGIEVNAYGGSGRINIRKSRISENGRYAIARVQRTNISSVWNGLTIEENNNFFGNAFGNVSSIFRVF